MITSAQADDTAAAPPEYDEVLAALRAVWRDVLGTPGVADGDNFFDIGGDSHAALRVWSRARDKGIEMPRAAVILRPVLRELAAAVLDPRRFESGER